MLGHIYIYGYVLGANTLPEEYTSIGDDDGGGG